MLCYLPFFSRLLVSHPRMLAPAPAFLSLSVVCSKNNHFHVIIRPHINMHTLQSSTEYLRYGARGLSHFSESSLAALFLREALVVLVLPAQRKQFLEIFLFSGLPRALVR